MFLEEIINGAELESSKTEYKEKLNHEDVLGWLKSVAGFSNAEGGNIYIGIEDKTHKLVGMNQADADNERNFFNNQVNEHISPRPDIRFDFLRYKIRQQERYVIHVIMSTS